MQSCTVAELGRKASAYCSEKSPVLVTNNGRPQSVIINIGGMDIDEVVDFAREAAARNALVMMRRQAVASGLDKLDDDEIQAEVDAARSQL